MNFILKDFIKEIHKEYKGIYSISEIEKLLNISDDYTTDTPFSTGKKLSISRVRIIGHKNSSESNNNSIDKNISFLDGSNIIIADNFKGKSSIFKIIKYALTGSNSIKNNVKKWIKHIFVVFKINEIKFTTYLDLTSNRTKAKLLKGEYYELEAINNSNPDVIIDASNNSEYEEKIQNFFFKQFSYYSLKWTQKSSKKDSNDMLESNASWKTYFKSILLESKDSSTLTFGDQGKKIFQMLLGLELTYPINRLSVKRDKLLSDVANENQISKKIERDIESIKLELNNINKEITEYKRNNEIHISIDYTKYNFLINKINELNKSYRSYVEKKNTLEIELAQTTINIKNYKNQVKKLDNELSKNTKYQNDLLEYIEIGSFFSNLDIKQCPCCNHKKESLKESYSSNCILCGDEINKEEQNIDSEIFNEKIENTKKIEINLKQSLSELDKKIESEKKAIEEIKINLNHCNNIYSITTEIENLKNELNILEKQISETQKRKMDYNEYDNLISRKAVLEFQLSEDDKYAEKNINILNNNINVINSAISKLSELRYMNAKKNLDQLSTIILDELHNLGLKSITEVVINEKFDIIYKQDNDYTTFDQIAEGEQLRAKLALYLGLIQLDIEHNLSKHTRLLIIDSPGKEEVDENFLKGFQEIIKSFENKFDNNFQIIIGTADRRLSGILNNEILYSKDEFVF